MSCELLVDDRAPRWCRRARIPRTSRSFSSTWRTRPPRNAMSLPARIGTCRSAIALVRVKRGIDVDHPRAARAEPRRPIEIRPDGTPPCSTPGSGCSRSCARSCWKVVAPPRPSDVPRPGTVEECHMRAWFSICTAPERGEQLLDEVVLLVVERRAAEAREAARAAQRAALRRRAAPRSRRGWRSRGRRSCPSPGRGPGPPIRCRAGAGT